MEKGIYPIIPNGLYSMVDDISLSGNFAKLIGELRAKIDFFNSAVVKDASADALEELTRKYIVLLHRLMKSVSKSIQSHKHNSGIMK